jgi:hypothetical protein
MIRSNPSNLASILDALHPIAPKYLLKGHENTTAVKEQQIHNQEDLHQQNVNRSGSHTQTSYTLR